MSAKRKVIFMLDVDKFVHFEAGPEISFPKGQPVRVEGRIYKVAAARFCDKYNCEFVILK